MTVPVVSWAMAGREAPPTAAPIARIVRILLNSIAFLPREQQVMTRPRGRDAARGGRLRPNVASVGTIVGPAHVVTPPRGRLLKIVEKRAKCAGRRSERAPETGRAARKDGLG